MFSFYKESEASSYNRVSQEESDSDSLVQPRRLTFTASKFAIGVLILSNLVTLSASILFWKQSRPPLYGSFAAGYATDFAPAKTHIQVEQVRFTGGPAYSEEGEMYIPNPAKVKYVGDPTPEIDQAWEKLIADRYVYATEEEMKAEWPDNYTEFWVKEAGSYVVGFDMLHTLHCLMRLREAFYPEYYGIDNTPHHRMHRDHCIEQVRQYIMCSGDMTPIPSRYYPSIDRSYVDSDLPHTCRNFGMLRDWVYKRFNDSPFGVIDKNER